MLLLAKDFTWSQQKAMALRACLNGQNVVAIVDTGRSGAVVSESCFWRLKLAHNGEIEFMCHTHIFPLNNQVSYMHTFRNFRYLKL